MEFILFICVEIGYQACLRGSQPIDEIMNFPIGLQTGLPPRQEYFL